jgi:hypothetical protein
MSAGYDFVVPRWTAVMLALGVSVAARADVYSWTDSDGVAHFTNLKPKGGQWKKVAWMGPDIGSKASARRGSCERCDKVAATDTSPERFHRYDPFILEASQLYRIPVPLIRAVIKVESDYDPRAISRAGAQGLMQLMPETAQRMQVRDVMDPRENVLGGVRYLRVLANMFNGDLQLTLAGYNAGENAVVRHGGIPPFDETEDYVARVLAYYRRYRETRDPVAASLGAVD